MDPGILAGPPLQLAFDLLLGSVKGAIEKVVFFKDELKKIQTTLEDLGPLIEQMEDFNKDLGRPPSEMQKLISAMEEAKKLIDECSSIRKSDILKRFQYTTKFRELDKCLRDLLETLKTQVARDVKEILVDGKIIARDVKEILVDRKIIARDVKEILVDFLDRIESIIKVTVGGSSMSQTQVENKYKITPPTFTFGLDAPLERLKKKLLEKDRPVLVLTAPGGSGKTTLAKRLCGDDQIKEKFRTNILFVKVSRTPNIKFIVQELYQNNFLKVPFLQDDEDAINHLEQFLRGTFGESPVLFVLDDVWSESESLIKKFNLQTHECKVLVTSRFAFPRFGPRYYLEILNLEDATNLFRHHAFSKHGNSHNIPDHLVNKVVGHCKKFPLALELVGTLLCNKPRQTWEREVRKWSQGTSILNSEDELFACLQRSINVMDKKDAILKELFMDLGSFPEDKLIPAATLIDLWTELYGLEADDVIAYIFDLTDRSLANFDFTRYNVDEEVEDEDYSEFFVTQHDMLRELAIYLSEKGMEQHREKLIVHSTGGNLPHWWKEKNEQPFNARLVSISTDGLFSSEWCDMPLPEAEALVLNFQTKNHALPEFLKNMSKLKVLIVSNYDYFPTELSNVQILGSLTNLKRIRLERIAITSLSETHINLENLQKLSFIRCKIGRAIKLLEALRNLVEINIECCMDLVKLPAGIGHLINLKKINITCCPLILLPEEIGNLVNLEVLRLRSCMDLKRLPDSVCKLSKLTFLDISGCIWIEELPENIGELCSLSNFNMKSCSRLWELPESVSKLKQLKNVVCGKRLKKQWESYFPNVKPKLAKDVKTSYLRSLWAMLRLR